MSRKSRNKFCALDELKWVTLMHWNMCISTKYTLDLKTCTLLQFHVANVSGFTHSNGLFIDSFIVGIMLVLAVNICKSSLILNRQRQRLSCIQVWTKSCSCHSRTRVFSPVRQYPLVKKKHTSTQLHSPLLLQGRCTHVQWAPSWRWTLPLGGAAGL